MKTAPSLLLECLVISTILFLAGIQPAKSVDDDDPDSRFHAPSSSENEGPCVYRRQEGSCKRRSLCNRPTRRVCRFGINPVVCCLDKDVPALTKPAPATTKRAMMTTRKPAPPKSEDMKEVDITYPGCGSRSRPNGNSGRPAQPLRGGRSGGGGGGSLFSRILGKRDTRSRSIRRSRRQLLRPVIVGGQTAKANSWPWMVAVFRQSVASSPKTFLCGASLISRRYVLCAAHCFDSEKGNINPQKFTINVGSHSTKDGTEYPVERVLVHQQYRAPQYYNDISLLKLRRDVTLGNKVNPVCLPSVSLRNQIRPNQSDVTVTGWGDTSFGGVNSKVLQEVSFPIVPLRECNESYIKVAKANFPRGISNEFICAGLKEGGKDACQGDSGGPMVMKLASDNYVQLGVVSFGYGCAKPGFPGVYTRVSKYSRWIYDNTDLGIK